MKRYDLYLGRKKASGEIVSKSEFYRFFGQIVKPLLKGCTITSGTGYYDGYFEEAIILTVVGPDNLAEDLNEIARDYAQRFQQESVLLLASDAESVLVGPDEATSVLPVDPETGIHTSVH